MKLNKKVSGTAEDWPYLVGEKASKLTADKYYSMFGEPLEETVTLTIEQYNELINKTRVNIRHKKERTL
jgi:hypothetical protein